MSPVAYVLIVDRYAERRQVGDNESLCIFENALGDQSCIEDAIDSSSDISAMPYFKPDLVRPNVHNAGPDRDGQPHEVRSVLIGDVISLKDWVRL